MKYEHNVILILVSCKWLIPYSGGSSKKLISFFHLSFRSSKFSRLYHFKASSYHCKASPCVFNFSFFLSSFYYRSSSWRLYMVVHQGFLSFFNCSSRFLSELWFAKLYSKINMVFNTCFVLRSSSILPLASKVQFSYLIFWDGVISFLTVSLQVLWFTSFQEWHI